MNIENIKIILKKAISDEAKINDFQNYFKDLIWKYHKKTEKLKPHIVGCFWILILLLIFK
jgi:hypothetical protein